jgi:hypothetical protein
MANIPIEKKGGGFPLVPVIVGVLVLLALLFFLARGCDDNNPATPDGLIEDTLTQDPDAGLGPNDGLAAPFASVDDIFADTTQLATYGGRSVRLNDVRVTSVVGDSTFYVQSNDGRRLFVVLEGMGEDEPGGPPDGQAAIREGQTLDLEGTLEQNTDFGRYGLSGSDLEAANRTGLLLRARRVEGA